ncbi:hypothetical protein PG997_000662 [Apiospora hydei]|uniref:VWFA domain-containing protein n=1 Tax=Apiospora hydei TaxID=1337664 RepID=A0ABR1XBL8_9PEZI
MSRRFEYHVFLDNNNDLGQHELQLMKDILEALRPQILESDKDTTIHYFQPDGNPTSREFPKHDPEMPNEAIEDFLEASGDGDDHMDAFVLALKSYDERPNGIPRNIIWITNGASLVAQEDKLINEIVEVMALEAKRGDKLISTHGGDLRYRPCGATFVQIGDNGDATQLFDKLPNSLRSEFKDKIEQGPPRLYGRAREHYEEGQKSDPKYYEKRLGIVHHVKLGSLGDAQRQLTRILMGGIDSEDLPEL